MAGGTMRQTKRGRPPFATIRNRKPTGVMGALLTCAGLFVVIVIAHYVINLTHLMMVRGELQDAVDAAALAGSGYLYRSPEDVEKAALAVAAGNFADGLRVSSQSPGTQIRVTTLPSDGIFPGCVKVEARRQIRFFGGALCGLPGSTAISASAMSGTAGSVTSVNQDQLFPLAVSVDAVPMSRTMAENSLSTHHLGDNIVLFTNAQQSVNVGFTTFFHPYTDYGYLKASIDQALTPQPGNESLIPKLSIGDSININNSAFGPHLMAVGGHLPALARRQLITVPVIVGNPRRDTVATVVAFATFRINGFEMSSSGQELNSINVTLVKGMVHGVSKPLPSTNKADVDDALLEFSTGVPKLLSADYVQHKLWLERRKSQAQSPALNHGDRLLTSSAQHALRLMPANSSPVGGMSASSTTPIKPAANRESSRLRTEQGQTSHPADSRQQSAWLFWLVLSIPLAIIAIRILTRQKPTAANTPAILWKPRRSGRRPRKLPKSPYSREFLVGSNPTKRT